MSDKTSLDLAAEITIAALGTSINWIENPDTVGQFYRTIYKEIATCNNTHFKDLP